MTQSVPLPVRVFFSAMLIAVFWLALQAIEARINPAGFDLGTMQRIQENAELSKQSFEAWQENQ